MGRDEEKQRNKVKETFEATCLKLTFPILPDSVFEDICNAARDNSFHSL